jgi:hypothetical protein
MTNDDFPWGWINEHDNPDGDVKVPGKKGNCRNQLTFFKPYFYSKSTLGLKIEHTQKKKVIYKTRRNGFSVSFISHFWFPRLSSEFPQYEIHPGSARNSGRHRASAPVRGFSNPKVHSQPWSQCRS